MSGRTVTYAGGALPELDSARICVVGAGIMGRGIALAFAVGGHVVDLVDRDPDIAAEATVRIRSSLAAATRAAVVDAAETPAVLERIQVAPSLVVAVETADLVVEAVPEINAIKREVWDAISRAASDSAVFTTNTSSFDIDVLAEGVRDRGRMLGAHWFNPAHIVPCVEVIPGRLTRPAVVEWTSSLLAAIGKLPVPAANTPGFVANRIQFAMIREALLCLQDGIATAAQIDSIVRNSFGLRLHALGPLALADLGGLDTYQAILLNLADRLGDRFDPPAVLDLLIAQGRLGTKTLAGIADYDKTSAERLAATRDAALFRSVNARPTAAD